MSIGTSDGKYFDNEFDFHADHFGLTTQEDNTQVAGDFPPRDKAPEAAPVTPPSNPRVPTNTGNEIIMDKGETIKGAVFGEDNEWHVKRGDRWFKITPSQGPRKPAGTLSDASPDPVQAGQQFAADVRKDPSMLGGRTGFPSGGGAAGKAPKSLESTGVQDYNRELGRQQSGKFGKVPEDMSKGKGGPEFQTREEFLQKRLDDINARIKFRGTDRATEERRLNTEYDLENLRDEARF